MALMAVGVGLDECRAAALTGTCERLGGDLSHREQVVAVDGHPGDAVGAARSQRREMAVVAARGLYSP